MLKPLNISNALLYDPKTNLKIFFDNNIDILFFF